MKPALKFLNSITDADASVEDAIVVCGSHGGLYPASIASKARVHAVIFNDAGIGLEGAGIAGVKALGDVGMAAAAADCMSARIGSADDMMKRGLISYANAAAANCGIVPDMPVAESASLLTSASAARGQLQPVGEARWEEMVEGVETSILFVDSASLVTPGDEGRIIITGSHGGLIGNDAFRAFKTRAQLAVFNDAGFGVERAGVSRLFALEQFGVAAVSVSHTSARIGDARSCLETGVISAQNTCASSLGFETGKSLLASLQP